MKKKCVELAVWSCVCLAVPGHAGGEAAAAVAEPYRWASVTMGGGGAVNSVIVHPRVKDLVYMRTDVGGFYRWQEADQSWTPLLDGIPFRTWNLYGGEGLAIDPGDASGNLLYAACGKSVSEWAEKAGGAVGCLMKSSDRGQTWQPLDAFGGRVGALGERLVVDPANGQHLFYLSKMKGLLESSDGAATWQPAAAALGLKPDGRDEKTLGLPFLLFDPAGGTVAGGQRSKVVYLGATGKGVCRSSDGGQTWEVLPGSHLKPRCAALGSDGRLFVSSPDGVARWDGQAWTVVTPAPDKTFRALAVDPHNPRHVLCAGDQNARNTPVYRSLDGGATWTQVPIQADETVPWWRGHHWLNSVFCLTFDPHYPGRVWASDWYGVYRTDDIAASPSRWTNLTRGHEELVCIGALASPPRSKYRLYSGLADVGGFDHEALEAAPSKHLWDKGFAWNTTSGIAWTPADPDFLVRVGGRNWNLASKGGGYTLNGGDTWVKFPTVPYPEIKFGRAVIAGAQNRILWFPQLGEPYATDDLGQTWRKLDFGMKVSAVMPGNHIFFYEQPVTLDLANPERVYVSYWGTLLRSDDAGATWRVAAKDLPKTKAIFTSGVPDEVWRVCAAEGLFRSLDGGVTWTRIDAVANPVLACAGQAPAGTGTPAIFVCGTVGGLDGYFRSDDGGAAWVRIDTQPGQRIGDDPNTMCADWRLPGAIFVGTNGRGIFHGSPAAQPRTEARQ